MKKIFLSIVLSLLILPMVLASNLVMSDLEGINLEGLSTETVESGNLLFRIETYTDTLGMYGHPSPKINQGERWVSEGTILDYTDISSSEELQTSFRIEFGLEASVQEGDFITLNYDGGQTLDVYLPNANVYDYFFVSTDGSTYYDDALTELAMASPEQIQIITGKNVIEIDTLENYQIDISTNNPDSECSDGICQVQYANWGLMNSNNEIVQEGNWERVYGSYLKDISIEILQVGEYILFAVITQIDLNFDVSSGEWISSEEQILVKESININVQYSITEPTIPQPSGFESFLSQIIDWLSNLWSILFG